MHRFIVWLVLGYGYGLFLCYVVVFFRVCVPGHLHEPHVALRNGSCALGPLENGRSGCEHLGDEVVTVDFKK